MISTIISRAGPNIDFMHVVKGQKEPSADNLCKQFGPRSGPFGTLIVFLKEIFEMLIFKKR